MTLVENVEIVHEDSACIITLRGEIEAIAVSAVRAQALAAVAACPDNAPQVVIDLSTVTFIDSSGIGLLVEIRREAVARSAAVSLRGTTPRVARLLTIIGLDELFGIED